MPFKIDHLTSDPHQRHTILFAQSQIDLDLRYHPTIEMWAIDLTYKSRAIYGVKLSLGVAHVRSYNWPFDVAVVDSSGSGIDPFSIDDFESGRCVIYMLDAADMELIRGVPVAI